MHPEKDPRALAEAETAAAAADPGGLAADRVLARLELKIRELASDPVVGGEGGEGLGGSWVGE